MEEGPKFDVGRASDEVFFRRAISHDRFTPEQARDDAHATYLLDYLGAIDAKTLVIEYEYTDGDYLDDFASYYVKCWADYERRCRRLHAFRNKFDREQFLAAVRTRGAGTIAAEMQANYLGFIVVRPLPEAIIGRTLLATYPSDYDRRKYTVVREYHANLFGIPLTVESLPYQEQDTVLAACATVALWSCFHKTAELFGTRAPTPAVITKAANNIVRHTRPIPSHGLSVEQICGAIRHVELEPEVFAHPNDISFVSLIYAYLRAGIPVLLGIDIDGHGLHAVALTGYSLQPAPVRTSEGAGPGSKAPLTGRCIDELYAHDDGIGPFSRIKIVDKGPGCPVTLEGSWPHPVTGAPAAMKPHVVIVPVYHKIRVTFVTASEWVTMLHFIVTAAGAMPADGIWDVYLSDSNDLKLGLSSGTPGDEAEQLLLRGHPRFVWYAALRSGDRVLAWMLADATDMDRSCPVYAIVWNDMALRERMRRLLGTEPLQKQLRDHLGDALLAQLRVSVGL